MAVPAHDDRDWAFARAYDLDVVRTIGPADDPYGPDLEAGAYTGDGVAVDSANDEIDLNGLGKDEAKAAMTAWLTEKGLGKRTVTYRLRDWLSTPKGNGYQALHLTVLGPDGAVGRSTDP